MTVIVAIIHGCGAQWYAKSPGLSKVYEKMPPCARSPDSNSPVSELTVCGVPSLFVQQTVVPAGTVSVSGSYPKLMMSTCVVPASQVGGGGGPVRSLIAGVLPTSAQTATAIVSTAK